MGATGVVDAGVGEGAGEVGLAGMGRGAGVAGTSVFSMEAAMESTCISISSSTEIVGGGQVYVPAVFIRRNGIAFSFGIF